jgi:hypothetical protein
MASMKKDISNSRTSPVIHKYQSHNREDEINLGQYLRIIHKRKYFVFSFSVLPALLFGIILFILPNNCKVTYAYDLGQDKQVHGISPGNNEIPDKLTVESEENEISAKDRIILLESFFDSGNIDKLAAKLRDNSFDEYARELSNTKIQTDISGTLLTMTVHGTSRQDLRKISSIIRDNFETNLLMYAAKQELSNNISLKKYRIAETEENKHNTKLELEEKLLNDINNSTFDSTQKVLSFLVDLRGSYQNTEFESYLNSYINKMENTISAYTALIKNPKIDIASKYVLKKSTIVFILLLIMTMSLAFLLEVAQKIQGPAP